MKRARTERYVNQSTHGTLANDAKYRNIQQPGKISVTLSVSPTISRLPSIVCCRLVFQPARRRPGERRRLLVDVAHVDHPVLRLVQSRPRANLVVPVGRHAAGTAEDAGGLRRGRPRMADLADGHPHLRRDDRLPRRHEGHVAVRGDMLADRPLLRDRRERQHRQEPDGDPTGLSHRVDRGQSTRGHLMMLRHL